MKAPREESISISSLDLPITQIQQINTLFHPKDNIIVLLVCLMFRQSFASVCLSEMSEEKQHHQCFGLNEMGSKELNEFVVILDSSNFDLKMQERKLTLLV